MKSATLLWEESFEPPPGKIVLSTNPRDHGAYVGDGVEDGLPVVQLPVDKLSGFEADDKMEQEESSANLAQMVTLIKSGNGNTLPPILTRALGSGYQVLDGHHRFHAFQRSGAKTIPSKVILADRVIETEDVNTLKYEKSI